MVKEKKTPFKETSTKLIFWRDKATPTKT